MARPTKAKRADLLAELQKCNDTIDAAYWRFCRCANAKPPLLECPEAYERRRAIEQELGMKLHRERPAK